MHYSWHKQQIFIKKNIDVLYLIHAIFCVNIMHSFFFSIDLPENRLHHDTETYRVQMGQGVLMRADQTHKYIATDGLRSCVAFALVNPDDSTGLLVHFYNLQQVRHDLKMMCDTFLEETPSGNQGTICIIAGGRD